MNRLLLALSFLLTGCFGVSGDGVRERELRELDAFVAIENHGELDVQVRQADAYRVTVSIDSNLVDNVRTRVRGETLIIDNNVNLLDKVSGPHVIVDMPKLVFAQLDGAGALRAGTFDLDETLKLELSGSGNLRFEGSAPRIDVLLDGAGDVRVIGSTDYADIELDGAGNVDARELEATEARLRIDGSGNIAATVHGDVDAEVSGSGDVDVYGDATLRRSTERGSGEIRLR